MPGKPEDEVPPDVLDALTDEGIEHLMLSLQGPGIMMVDGSQDADVDLEPTFRSEESEPELDSEEAKLRMADLRYTLGVSGTARPVPPRTVPPPMAAPPSTAWVGWALVAAVGFVGVLAMLAAAIALLVAGFA